MSFFSAGVAMRGCFIVGALVCVLGACGGAGSGVADLGPPPSDTTPTDTVTLRMSLLSGDEQVIVAGTEGFLAPVVIQVSGKSLTASASTVVLCATTLTGLTPFAACSSSDADGKVTFYFTPSHSAGVQMAEIRGVVNGDPIVFDTVQATVIPDAPARVGASYDSPIVLPGRRIPWSFVMLDIADRFGNRLTSPSMQITTPGWSMVGDSIQAPATEGRARVDFLIGDTVHFSTYISVMPDFAARHVELTWACGYNYRYTDQGRINDSSASRMALDSVLYGPAELSSNGGSLTVNSNKSVWFYSGTTTYYPAESDPYSIEERRFGIALNQQTDSLILAISNHETGTPMFVRGTDAHLVRVSDNPLTYTAADGCYDTPHEALRPLTAQEQ